MGQLGKNSREPLGDLLARPIQIDTFVEFHRDIGDSVFRNGTNDLFIWDTEQLEFNWPNDPLLNLFRGHPRTFKNHGGLNRRDFRERIDR